MTEEPEKLPDILPNDFENKINVSPEELKKLEKGIPEEMKDKYKDFKYQMYIPGKRLLFKEFSKEMTFIGNSQFALASKGWMVYYNDKIQAAEGQEIPHEILSKIKESEEKFVKKYKAKRIK